jgi:hypothetical protein
VQPRRITDEMRMWIMVLVFVVLGITFIISVAAIFNTTNAEVLKFAFDTVKTLLGFFIGVATGFNAIADRERYFVLAISDVNEKMGAGIVIEFEEAVTSLIFEFHTNANLSFGLAGFQFCH